MALTLSGDAVTFVRHPGRGQPVRQRALPHTPEAWLVLMDELLGLPLALAITSWAALSACPLSEAQTLRLAVLAWPVCQNTWPWMTAKGITLARLLHSVELCVLCATLAPREATIIETAILAQVDAAGRWKEPMLQ